MNKPVDEEYPDDEDYDEYEIEEMPLWKKVVNELMNENPKLLEDLDYEEINEETRKIEKPKSATP